MQILAPGILVAGQISPDDVEQASERGVRAIVDMRPDDEEPGQPSAAAVGASARGRGLAFSHVPVPLGDPPDAAAADLAAALATADGPVLLYCRSGRRAARVWALAEASRLGGLEAEAIRRAVEGIGQPVDDLAPRIEARITARRS